MFPSIFIHWKNYQNGLMEKLKDHDNLVFAGDGRHDSMGHSAKYCAYTIFCCTFSYSIYHILIYTMYTILSSQKIPMEKIHLCLEKVVFKWYFPLSKHLRTVKVSMQFISQCTAGTCISYTKLWGLSTHRLTCIATL